MAFTKTGNQYIKFLCLAIILLFTHTRSMAREKQYRLQARETIAAQARILDKFKNRYKLFAIDMFEEKQPWIAKVNSSMLSRVSYIKKIPDMPEFEQEKSLIKKYIGNKYSFKKSLSIHTSFDLPGEQNYYLYSTIQKQIIANPKQVSVWINSNNYKHTLYLEIETIQNKTYQLKIARLNFSGWKRFTANLPASVFKRPKSSSITQNHLFKGFVIKSHPRQKAGSLNILIDDLIVICDLQILQYPGSEIQDVWE